MEKSRYWVAVGYPENFRDDWQDEISNLLQLPFAYCIHDKDLQKDGTPRKAHVHIMLMFAGPTTEKSALSVFKNLEKPTPNMIKVGEAPVQHVSAFPNDHIERIVNVRQKYEYLIHNTDDCKRKKKHLYDAYERITGNNFDIGSYEQVSLSDKLKMKSELTTLIWEKDFINYMDFMRYVQTKMSMDYFEIASSCSGYFSACTKGAYQARFVRTHSDKADEIPAEDSAQKLLSDLGFSIPNSDK